MTWNGKFLPHVEQASQQLVTISTFEFLFLFIPPSEVLGGYIREHRWRIVNSTFHRIFSGLVIVLLSVWLYYHLIVDVDKISFKSYLLPGLVGKLPRNFTDKSWQTVRTDGELMWILKNGSSGTAMVSFVPETLTEKEAWQIILVIRAFGN